MLRSVSGARAAAVLAELPANAQVGLLVATAHKDGKLVRGGWGTLVASSLSDENMSKVVSGPFGG